ncbi:MAG: hypothetical protein ACFE0R_13265 [Salinarimonas sp.]
MSVESSTEVSTVAFAPEYLLTELRSNMGVVCTIEDIVMREGVGSGSEEQDLRRTWAQCDALAERIAGLRPATMEVVRAKAAAYLWLEGWCGPQSEEMRARIVAEVMSFLAGEPPPGAGDA